jgi:hypothetical protein
MVNIWAVISISHSNDVGAGEGDKKGKGASPARPFDPMFVRGGIERAALEESAVGFRKGAKCVRTSVS